MSHFKLTSLLIASCLAVCGGGVGGGPRRRPLAE